MLNSLLNTVLNPGLVAAVESVARSVANPGAGPVPSPVPVSALRPAYDTLQQGVAAAAFAHKQVSSRLLRWVTGVADSAGGRSLDPKLLASLRQTMADLGDRDWADGEAGVYPLSLLVDRPWGEFAAAYPWMCLDTWRTWDRAQNKRHQEFDSAIDTAGYPAYYLQNFHHQTDGYLSDFSANLYDLQVEVLFNGTADAMRRRVLAPLREGLNAFAEVPPSQVRVLDAACGTGRTLRFLRSMLPLASLVGVDLSPAYLRKANQWLSTVPGDVPQLVRGNVEALPFADRTFHGVTSTFLFHELPAAVRQTAIAELYRVAKPGAILVLCDSLQAGDRPEWTPMLENFPQMFHEPYYRHYLTDDLGEHLTAVGFEAVQTEVHFVSKYWIARKPSDA